MNKIKLFMILPGSRLNAQKGLGEKVDRTINKAMTREGLPYYTIVS